jgi:trans-aconitate methyltransferase
MALQRIDYCRSVANKPTKTTYDSLASSYDHRWRHYIAVSLSKVIDALSPNGHEHMLNAACGTGELERRLLARWPELQITGVDLSPKMFAQAVSLQSELEFRLGPG